LAQVITSIISTLSKASVIVMASSHKSWGKKFQRRGRYLPHKLDGVPAEGVLIN
jgi:hypothetical protein